MGFDNPNIEAQVRDLNDKLEKARHAYYVLAQPIMSDAEFDALEARLRAVVKANPWFGELATALHTVGSDASNGSRVKHVRPMLSIENQYTKEDIVKFFLTLPTGASVDIEPKRDGISCELRYVNGHLKAAITRGTGVEGEDMTAQVKALKDVPQFLPSNTLLELATKIHVRGELVMRDSELERINKVAAAAGQKTYASTRNLTAGTMKQKDLNVVASREILFMPWDVYSPEADGQLPDSNYDRMTLLERAGFPKYEGVRVSKDTDIITKLDAILALNAKSDIRADGVVIKVDSHSLRKELGVASKFTNWMTCFKPQSAAGTTYLREVIWQIGRQGKLTPVASCDPVPLAGAMVTRASLNNETWIETMGLTLGAKVEMLRSGDVIPQVTKVLDATGTPIEPPTKCPECSTKLEVYTDDKSNVTTRWCQNIECPGRVRDLFTYIGSRDILEIDGLADEMATKLVKDGYARNIGELLTFQTEALEGLNGLKKQFGELGEDKFLGIMARKGFTVHILKMVNSMETAKKADWDRWLAALGIPLFGRTLGKLLAKELKLEAEDMKNLPAKLEQATTMKVEGLGDTKIDILRRWSLDPVNRETCQALYDAGVRPTALVAKSANGATPLAGMAFCITGEFSEDRDGITRKLESLGAVSKSGVSKNINLLIVGEGAGKSKLTKYEELVARGCKIEKVGKDWLLKVFEANGLTMGNAKLEIEEV